MAAWRALGHGSPSGTSGHGDLRRPRCPLRPPLQHKEGTEMHSPLGTGTGTGDAATSRTDGQAPAPGPSLASA